MAKRQKMSRKGSARAYKKGLKTSKKNLQSPPARGGHRL